VIDDQVARYLAESAKTRIRSLVELLSIPSVSAIPESAGDCREAAGWVAADLRRAGMENVQIHETGGHPIVYGDWLHGKSRRTALIYSHYDVQPVDPVELWRTPPFVPVIEGDRIVGRGAADSKCHVEMHIRAAEAMLAVRGRLPLNLRFLFEGEEEISSLHFDKWLLRHRARLNCDVAVVSDTNFFDGNVPAIPIGLRGVANAQIDVYGADVDLHSGNFGGTVENPAGALVAMVASLRSGGRVTVDGFYDDVVALTDEDRSVLADLPFDEDAYRESIGASCLAGEAGYTTLERRGARPTLDVTGLWAGYRGQGPKNIIPGEAHAKISCRLVPNQDPGRVLSLIRDHIRRVSPLGVRVEVQDLGTSDPMRIPPDHPAIEAAARAIEATFGRAPLLIREGGSIGPAASIHRLLGVPIVLLGFAPPDDHSHAPNEWMSLANFEMGIRTLVRFWDDLAHW
jgi:acetylornithine deacetylase/succinyl-diaminopimelate desuccinylase-like protein